MQHHGQRSLFAGFASYRVAEAVHFFDPARGFDCDFSLVLAGEQGDAIEAEIIHDDPVRQILHIETQLSILAVALYLHPGRNTFTGRDGDLPGLGRILLAEWS